MTDTTNTGADPTAAAGGQEGVGAGQADTGTGAPSEDELRAAYEAELSRITSTDLIVQTLVSLLNVGGRRLGLVPGSEGDRDLEQVRDAIDAVRGLMPVIERRMAAAELRPLRDALAQLQMAYAREAGATPKQGAEAPPGQPGGQPSQPADQPESPAGQPAGEAPKGPGPAEASGRLWVPGR